MSRHPIDPDFISFYSEAFRPYTYQESLSLIIPKSCTLLVPPTFIAMWMMSVGIKYANIETRQCTNEIEDPQEKLLSNNNSYSNSSTSTSSKNYSYSTSCSNNTLKYSYLINVYNEILEFVHETIPITLSLKNIKALAKKSVYNAFVYINSEIHKQWTSKFMNAMGETKPYCFQSTFTGTNNKQREEVPNIFESISSAKWNSVTINFNILGVGQNKDLVKTKYEGWNTTAITESISTVGEKAKGFIVFQDYIVSVLDGSSRFTFVHLRTDGHLECEVIFGGVSYPRIYWNTFIQPHFDQLNMLEKRPEHLKQYGRYLKRYFNIYIPDHFTLKDSIQVSISARLYLIDLILDFNDQWEYL